MRGVITASAAISNVNTAKTLLIVETGSSSSAELLSCEVTNHTSPIPLSENWRLSIHRKSSGMSSGSSADSAKHEPNDGTTPLQATSNLTSEPTYESAPVYVVATTNNDGFKFEPQPEERPICGPNSGFGIRLLTTPGAANNLTVRLTYRVLG